MLFEIGARVETEKTGKGRVAFCGEVQLSDGEWLGVILDEPRGKNNGTVQGVQYFTCELNHGLFVRPAQLKLESAHVTPTTKARASPGGSPKVNLSVSTERLSKAARSILPLCFSKLDDTANEDSPKVNPSVSTERLSKAAGPKLEMCSSELADTTNEGAAEAEGLRRQLEEKDLEILELKKTIKSRLNDISNYKLRLDMAEARIESAAKQDNV
ncbi:hypothetical protein Q1695_005579 [Nippostrongylus brasiliensis]|nr:hypothetical protein Q1695_005579 [Nippostrongylus brasiliensis]